MGEPKFHHVLMCDGAGKSTNTLFAIFMNS